MKVSTALLLSLGLTNGQLIPSIQQKCSAKYVFSSNNISSAVKSKDIECYAQFLADKVNAKEASKDVAAKKDDLGLGMSQAEFIQFATDNIDEA